MQGGGAERVAALLCNRWVEKGHKVTLVPTYSQRGTNLYPLNDKVKLIFLADVVGTKKKTIWAALNRVWSMRKLVKTTRPDVVLSFLPQVNIVTLLATRGLNIPVVVSERVFPPAFKIGKIWERLRKITYPFAKRVVMQTEGGLDWLKNDIGAANGVAIPNPCAFPLPIDKPIVKSSLFTSENRNLLLAVGRLEEQKQFDLLLRCFAKLSARYSDWDLAIIGEGDKRQSLEDQIENLGLKHRAYLPGRIGNVGDWYSRADIYALTSRFEGFPNSLLEALSHGVPSISFDCATGPAEMIIDRQNGFLISPKDGEIAFSNRLEKLMSNEALRKSMSRHAVEVREKFSFEKVGAKWDRVLGLTSDVQHDRN